MDEAVVNGIVLTDEDEMIDMLFESAHDDQEQQRDELKRAT